MTDYDTYGSQWSSLFAQSWKLLEDGIRGAVLDAIKVNDWVASFSRTQFPQLTPTIRASIGKQMADRMESKAWDQCLLTWILGQINAAAMEISFRHVFPGAPVFFERLLEVYDKGRLPCGWDGDLNEWADGRLMLH
jgi:hypothetical protein